MNLDGESIGFPSQQLGPNDPVEFSSVTTDLMALKDSGVIPPPPSGYSSIYFKNDGLLYSKSALGLERLITSESINEDKWKFSSSVMGSPTHTYFRINTPTFNLLTEIAISIIDNDNDNLVPLLGTLRYGSMLYLCNATNTNCKLIDLKEPTDNTSWFSYNATLRSENNTAPFDLGEVVKITFYPTLANQELNTSSDVSFNSVSIGTPPFDDTDATTKLYVDDQDLVNTNAILAMTLQKAFTQGDGIITTTPPLFQTKPIKFKNGHGLDTTNVLEVLNIADNTTVSVTGSGIVGCSRLNSASSVNAATVSTTGNLTVGGVLENVSTQNILPSVNATNDIGSALSRYSTIHANTLKTNKITTLEGASDFNLTSTPTSFTLGYETYPTIEIGYPSYEATVYGSLHIDDKIVPAVVDTAQIGTITNRFASGNFIGLKTNVLNAVDAAVNNLRAGLPGSSDIGTADVLFNDTYTKRVLCDTITSIPVSGVETVLLADNFNGATALGNPILIGTSLFTPNAGYIRLNTEVPSAEGHVSYPLSGGIGPLTQNWRVDFDINLINADAEAQPGVGFTFSLISTLPGATTEAQSLQGLTVEFFHYTPQAPALLDEINFRVNGAIVSTVTISPLTYNNYIPIRVEGLGGNLWNVYISGVLKASWTQSFTPGFLYPWINFGGMSGGVDAEHRMTNLSVAQLSGAYSPDFDLRMPTLSKPYFAGGFNGGDDWKIDANTVYYNKPLFMGTNRAQSNHVPADSADFTNKLYVDTKLAISGGTISGVLETNTIQPVVNNTHDLGTTQKNYKNLYCSGSVYVGNQPVGFVKTDLSPIIPTNCTIIGINAAPNVANTSNTAIGKNSMLNITTGSSNTAVGSSSLLGIVSGLRNTSLGSSSLQQVTLGGDNLGLGYQTGMSLSTGSYNILLGNQANVTSASSIRRIAIGAGSTCDSDNTCVIGNTAIAVIKAGSSNLCDLGTDPRRFKDLWLSGNINGLTPIGGVFSGMNDAGGLSTGSGVAINITPTSGIGSLTVPMNDFKLGDAFHLKIGGLFSAQNGHTFQIGVKANTSNLALSPAFSFPGLNNIPFEISIDFVFRSIGGAGVAAVISSGSMTYTDGTYKGITIGSLSDNTFDTTISNTLSVIGTFVGSPGTDAILSTTFLLSKIF